MRYVLSGLRQVPLQVTGEPRAVIEHTKQDGRLPLAARREHLLRSVVAVPVPQAVHVLGLVAAHFAVEEPRLGALCAVGPPRRDPPPLLEAVRLEEAA